MVEENIKTFYDYRRIAALIDAAPVSQVQLAEAVGVTPVTISRVKTGTASPLLLARIAGELGFDYRQYLLSASEVVAQAA